MPLSRRLMGWQDSTRPVFAAFSSCRSRACWRQENIDRMPWGDNSSCGPATLVKQPTEPWSGRTHAVHPYSSAPKSRLRSATRNSLPTARASNSLVLVTIPSSFCGGSSARVRSLMSSPKKRSRAVSERSSRAEAGQIEGATARRCHEAHQDPVRAAERRVVAHRPQVILGGDERRCCDPLRVLWIGLHNADDLAPPRALRQPTEADVSRGM